MKHISKILNEFMTQLKPKYEKANSKNSTGHCANTHNDTPDDKDVRVDN